MTLIHAARIHTNGRRHYLFLRKNETGHFTWHEEQENSHDETQTPISAQTAEEALRLAPRHWKNHSWQTVHCGFRYTLPERDEHGINAFFHQMAASQNSSNGVYYDDEIGNNCFVQNASDEALTLLQRLKQQNRL